VLGIGEALPFRDASFDLVFTLSVVPHTAHPLW
jgi:ubiquinone/menaquinone biosynthesis C-methylase UbiE